MEVDWISTKLEGLANVEEFDIHDLANTRLVAMRVQHDMRAVLVLRRSFWVTSVFDISGKKTDFCAHVNKV